MRLLKISSHAELQLSIIVDYHLSQLKKPSNSCQSVRFYPRVPRMRHMFSVPQEVKKKIESDHKMKELIIFIFQFASIDGCYRAYSNPCSCKFTMGRDIFEFERLSASSIRTMTGKSFSSPFKLDMQYENGKRVRNVGGFDSVNTSIRFTLQTICLNLKSLDSGTTRVDVNNN